MVKMRQFKSDYSSVSKVFNEYFCDVAGSTGHILEIDDFNNHQSINTIKEKTNASNSTFCFVQAGSDSRGGGGTLGISWWGCAAGTLEPLTRASSAEFCYPILE